MAIALLHIGTHKTGTTSFQRWAHVNRSALRRKHDIHVFQVFDRSFGGSNLALPLLCTRSDRNTPALIANPEARLVEYQDALQSHVAREVDQDAEFLLISAEDLCLLRHGDEVEAVADMLAPRELRVAVSLREPVAYLESYRAQMERLGQTASDDASSHTYYGSDTWLTRFDDMLAVWESVLGAERVSSFSYEEAMREHGSSIPALLQQLGLSPDDLPTWRGFWENVTASEQRSRGRLDALYRHGRHALAHTAPGRALRGALRPQ